MRATTCWRAGGPAGRRPLALARGDDRATAGRARSGVVLRSLRVHLKSAMARTYASADVRTWLTENARLLASAESEARDFLWNSHDYPSVTLAGDERPRVSVLAAVYLDKAAKAGFSEEGLAAFLRGAQDAHDLQLGELWAVRGALMLELLHRVVAAAADEDEERLPLVIDSIRRIGDANWKQLFASVSVVDARTGGRPVGRVRGHGRQQPRRLPARGVPSWRVMGRRANAKSRRQPCASPMRWPTPRRQARPMPRRDGCTSATTWWTRACRRSRRSSATARRCCAASPDAVTSVPTGFYLGGVTLVTLAIVVSMLDLIDARAAIGVAFLLLLLPAMQAAVEFVNALVPAVTRPRAVPKLDFSKGIPADCETMVAVPALLLNEQHVHELVMDLEIRYLANRDPQLHFALLSDSVDAVDRAGAACEPLVPLAVSLVEGLNARYGTTGRTPFYLFHRAPCVQRVRAAVDGMGAQARQAAGPEPAAAGRIRQLPGEGGQPRRVAAHPLRDHARQRHAVAA